MVQQELKEAMQMGEMLEQTGNNVWIGALTAEGAAYGPDWKVGRLRYGVGALPGVLFLGESCFGGVSRGRQSVSPGDPSADHDVRPYVK